jgi:hypothetical protein
MKKYLDHLSLLESFLVIFDCINVLNSDFLIWSEAFFIGSIEEVNKKISKLDKKLQKYTALVVESRTSNYEDTDDTMSVASARGRDRYEKRGIFNANVIIKCLSLDYTRGLIENSECFINHCFGFLAHLSWKLKWAFLIAGCPSSVCPSIRLSVYPSIRL